MSSITGFSSLSLQFLNKAFSWEILFGLIINHLPVPTIAENFSFLHCLEAKRWPFEIASNKLIFKYAGTAKMELDTSGNLTITGAINANGTIA